MCGITGFFATGTDRLSGPLLQGLLLTNEARGRDATGMCYIEDNELIVRKAPQKASEFLVGKDEIFAYAANTNFALMHTRFKTKGSEKNNENNHPVTAYNWAVTHNGGVMNDDDLFVKFQDVTRAAEVDTVAINLVLAQEGIKGIPLLGGSASFAAWTPDDPEKVILARVGGNDVFLFMPSPGLYVWSSDFHAVYMMSRSKFGHLPMAKYATLPENVAMVLSPSGVETFRLKRRPFYTPKTVRTSYHYGGYTPANPLPALAPSTTPTPTSTTVGGGSRLALVGARETKEYRELSFDMAPFKTDLLKPQPLFVIKGLELPPRDTPTDLMTHALKSPGVKFMPTPYGTWMAEDGKGVWFRPHKRVKTWQAENFYPWWAGKVDDIPKEYLDNQLPLELVSYRDNNLPRHYAGIRQIYLCPWCGVSECKWIWEKWKMTCLWCQIKALKPTGDTYTWAT